MKMRTVLINEMIIMKDKDQSRVSNAGIVMMEEMLINEQKTLS
jgi:hypothetical protein